MATGAGASSRHHRGAAVERSSAEQFAYARREEEPTMAPPRSEVGAIGWLRANLFSNVTNTILTVLGLAAGRLDRAAVHPLGISQRRLGGRRPR